VTQTKAPDIGAPYNAAPSIATAGRRIEPGGSRQRLREVSAVESATCALAPVAAARYRSEPVIAPRHDPDRVLAAVAERGLALELGTLDLCFVVALYVRGQGAQLPSFTEPQLEDVFTQVCAVVQPDAEQIKRRGTHAIQRLRDQRMLVRVDGQGVVRTGEFALSRLASGIVEFYLEEDVLTRESLTLLTRTLLSSLGQIHEAAQAAQPGDEAAWHDGVVGPLRVTISELVAGIERRQRGLDLQQEEFQSEIRRLLEADWFGAIDRCQALLESTSATLRELNDVLLRDTSKLLMLLHDVQELAIAASVLEAEAACHRLMDQVDRIAAWGSARQRAWSEYFQYVHRYLRDVVRLDPTRALTQRLRDQLAGTAGKSFSLTLAGMPPIRLLRAVTPPRERPPVTRPRAPREREPEADAGEDPQQVLENRVRGALDAGAVALSEVTSSVTGELPGPERFVMAGRVAHTVAQLARARSAIDRPWVAAGEDLVIEEWAIGARGAAGGDHRDDGDDRAGASDGAEPAEAAGDGS
jgi:chromosome partition protein MukF